MLFFDFRGSSFACLPHNLCGKRKDAKKVINWREIAFVFNGTYVRFYDNLILRESISFNIQCHECVLFSKHYKSTYFAMNGSWVTRDSVHFSRPPGRDILEPPPGWSQDIFSWCQEIKRLHSVHLFIYTKQFDFYEVIIIRGYDYLASDEQKCTFGSG